MNQKFRKKDREIELDTGKHLDNKTDNNNEKILSIQCILILGLGILLSVISFILEILIIN